MPLAVTNLPRDLAVLNKWALAIENQLRTHTTQITSVVNVANNAAASASEVNVYAVQATLTFGNADSPDGQDTTARTTLTGLTWVKTTTCLVATFTDGSADHPDPDEAIVEGIVLSIGNVQPGIGFDICAYAPRGTWGTYNVNVVGAN
jgi:hypothetical protein